MYPIVNTKWGDARVRDGYYKVGKKNLHRLIYEDNHQCTLLSTTHIHHINGNKLDNSIENLIALTPAEHRHEHKKLNKKIREQRRKEKHEIIKKGYPKIVLCKNGVYAYLWTYSVGRSRVVKHGRIIDKDIVKLEQRVKLQGLCWISED